MNRKIITVVILLLSIYFMQSLSALEIGTMFHASNLDFSSDRAKTDTYVSGYDYKWGLSLYGIIPISDSFTLTVGNFYDPILKNTLYNLIQFEHNYVQLSMGPFFDAFHNTDNIIQSGLSTKIRVDLPGLLFLSFLADSTIGGRLVKEGDYLHERNRVEAGFYAPNVICSFVLDSKTYTEKLSAEEKVTSLTQYAVKTDIYKKNIPYRILLTFAYQTQTVDYIGATTVTHTLNSLVMGTKLTTAVNDTVSFILDIESNIYSFGKSQDVVMSLPSSGPDAYLFRASTGFIVHID